MLPMMPVRTTTMTMLAMAMTELYLIRFCGGSSAGGGASSSAMVGAPGSPVGGGAPAPGAPPLGSSF
jgi:hypothetical protein